MEKGTKKKRPKFAIIGLGFISETHLDAIDEVGGELIAACDIDNTKWYKVPSHCALFMHWETMMADPIFKDVTHVSICTPNYLHYEMIHGARALDKVVICEKPLVINPNQVLEFGKDVYSILQLRHSPLLSEIWGSVKDQANEVKMDISVHRGQWYFKTWKNNVQQSGGLVMNIGIHYLDLVHVLFGKLNVEDVWIKTPNKTVGGVLTNEKVFVSWSLSLEAPKSNQKRLLVVNGREFNLSRKFTNLHSMVYKRVLQGKGTEAIDAYSSLKLVDKINNQLGVFIDEYC